MPKETCIYIYVYVSIYRERVWSSRVWPGKPSKVGSLQPRQASNAFRAISFVVLRSLAAQGVDTSTVQLLRVPGLRSPRSSDATGNHIIALEMCRQSWNVWLVWTTLDSYSIIGCSHFLLYNSFLVGGECSVTFDQISWLLQGAKVEQTNQVAECDLRGLPVEPLSWRKSHKSDFHPTQPVSFSFCPLSLGASSLKCSC